MFSEIVFAGSQKLFGLSVQINGCNLALGAHPCRAVDSVHSHAPTAHIVVDKKPDQIVFCCQGWTTTKNGGQLDLVDFRGAFPFPRSGHSVCAATILHLSWTFGVFRARQVAVFMRVARNWFCPHTSQPDDLFQDQER